MFHYNTISCHIYRLWCLFVFVFFFRTLKWINKYRNWWWWWWWWTNKWTKESENQILFILNNKHILITWIQDGIKEIIGPETKMLEWNDKNLIWNQIKIHNANANVRKFIHWINFLESINWSIRKWFFYDDDDDHESEVYPILVEMKFFLFFLMILHWIFGNGKKNRKIFTWSPNE